MPAGWTDEEYRRVGMTPPGKEKPAPKKRKKTIMTANSADKGELPEVEEEKSKRRGLYRFSK